MNNVISCGGVVFFEGKILILYKNLNNRYKGWVLPKGTVEEGLYRAGRGHCPYPDVERQKS